MLQSSSLEHPGYDIYYLLIGLLSSQKAIVETLEASLSSTDSHIQAYPTRAPVPDDART